MTGHMYAASFFTAGVTVLQDLFQLVAITNPATIHSIRIGQSSDEGDAQAEMLQIQISRTDLTVNGSGGSTLTPVQLSPGSPSATTVVEANNTTISTVTTPIVEDSFNVQAGWLWLPTPEERILLIVSATAGIVVELPVAPSDPLDMTGTIIFEEHK